MADDARMTRYPQVLRTVENQAVAAETAMRQARSSQVTKLVRKTSMAIMIVVAVLALLALITQAGVFAVERAHPAAGHAWSRYRALGFTSSISGRATPACRS